MRALSTPQLLCCALLALCGSGLSSQSSQPIQAKPWILGIARFSPANAGDEPTSLQDTLPRLIAAELRVLPTRHVPDEAASETGERETLRAHFTAGDDLASKLDARASRFLEAAIDENAKRDLIAAADKQVLASAKKLADLDAEGAAPTLPPSDREARLWDGHAKGLLVDAPLAGPMQTAKASGLDLLLTGTIGIQADYAIIQVKGFDTSLEREVFSWKSYCSVDDPQPAASELADQLELWVAGRDFARLELSLKPASVELRINGELFAGQAPVFYVYERTRLRLEARASGYASAIQDIELAPGERRNLSMSLEPLSTGQVTLVSDPEGAAVSLDSVPLGRAPVSIGLDGSRGIATLSSEGREPQSIVLPASGDSELRVSLLPSDGLGPAGRISASKDQFYQSLGWFVLSIPVTSLTAGLFRAYDEAYARSGDEGMLVSRNVSVGVLVTAIAATGSAAFVAILRLVRYLGSAH